MSFPISTIQSIIASNLQLQAYTQRLGGKYYGIISMERLHMLAQETSARNTPSFEDGLHTAIVYGSLASNVETVLVGSSSNPPPLQRWHHYAVAWKVYSTVESGTVVD